MSSIISRSSTGEIVVFHALMRCYNWFVVPQMEFKEEELQKGFSRRGRSCTKMKPQRRQVCKVFPSRLYGERIVEHCPLNIWHCAFKKCSMPNDQCSIFKFEKLLLERRAERNCRKVFREEEEVARKMKPQRRQVRKVFPSRLCVFIENESLSIVH